MKAATIVEIKQELMNLPGNTLIEFCLRLAKFKKENKELLTYLLFEANDEAGYIKCIKTDMEQEFESINTSNIYYAKKSLRKILRNTNKYIRYSGSRQTEIELLLFYCQLLNKSGIPIQKSPVLINLYQSQLKKLNKTIDTLHEDLQYDYQKKLKEL